MKVYSANTDGTYREAVAAPNQREAVQLLGMSVYSFRQYGVVTEEPGIVALATAEPGVMFRRKMAVWPEPPWERK